VVVAFDATNSAYFGGDGGTPTVNGPTAGPAALPFTGAAGAALVAAVNIGRVSQDVSGNTLSVTYNGVAMSSLRRQAPPSTSAVTELFGLLNACDGSAHNIVVTMTGISGLIIVGGLSATGCNSFTGVTSTSSTSTTSPTLNVTSAAGDLVFAAGAHGDIISGSNNTSRWIIAGEANSTGGSNGAGATAAGAATVNMTWTSSLSDHWAVIGVNLSAASEGGQDLPPDLRGPIPPGVLGPLVTFPSLRM
jgi:hypothetical protein